MKRVYKTAFLAAILVGAVAIFGGYEKHPVAPSASCQSWAEAASLAADAHIKLLEMPADLVPTALRIYNNEEPKSDIEADRIILARVDPSSVQIVLVSHGCIVSMALTTPDGAKAIWNAAEKSRV